jgi:hypothetical protein
MKSKLTIAVIVALGLILWIRSRVETSPSPHPPTPLSRPADPEPIPSLGAPIGDQFLEDYGDPSTPATLDIDKVGRVVEGLHSLFKNLDTRLIANNSLLASFLRGNNPEGLVYLSPEHPIFGPDGTLRDRWGSPFLIHPIGTGIIEIRSAGPDGTPYTDDDLIRDPRGGVRSGSTPAQPGGPGP